MGKTYHNGERREASRRNRNRKPKHFDLVGNANYQDFESRFQETEYDGQDRREYFNMKVED